MPLPVVSSPLSTRLTNCFGVMSVQSSGTTSAPQDMIPRETKLAVVER